MENMPEHVICDLSNKVHKDIADAILRTADLVNTPVDKFRITLAAAQMSVMCLSATAQLVDPALNGTRAQVLVMQELNKILQGEDGFITTSVAKIRKERG